MRRDALNVHLHLVAHDSARCLHLRSPWLDAQLKRQRGDHRIRNSAVPVFHLVEHHEAVLRRKGMNREPRDWDLEHLGNERGYDRVTGTLTDHRHEDRTAQTPGLSIDYGSALDDT
jgi:hypothetical protein